MSDPDVLARLRKVIADAAERSMPAPGPQVTGRGDRPLDRGVSAEGSRLGKAAGDGSSQADPDSGKAFAFLVRSTRQRPISVAEARSKLKARAHDDEVIDVAVARAIEARILDDHAFAQAWVGDRGVKRGYGRQRLRRELQRRKVEDAEIEAALEQLDDDAQRSAAFELARKRAQAMPATLEPHKVAGRLVGMLVRRGFSSDLAHGVARQVTALDRDWD